MAAEQGREPERFSYSRVELVVQEVIAKMKELIETKGYEYSGGVDAFGNFRRQGKEMGLPMEAILRVYAGKHWDSIGTYIRGLTTGSAQKPSEPIEGRIDDLIVYLVLLRCMCLERKGQD